MVFPKIAGAVQFRGGRGVQHQTLSLKFEKFDENENCSGLFIFPAKVKLAWPLWRKVKNMLCVINKQVK